MKGPAKRFLDHKGKAYPAPPHHDDVGFLDLWRYASAGERACCLAGAALAWGAAAGLVAAVTAYGELTALFVQRSAAARAAPTARLLPLFGGGAPLPAGNRTAHMEALVADSAAFGLASLAIMCVQLACAAAAVSLCEWSARRSVSRLRLRLLECVISQEMAYFDTNTCMNFASALTEDTEKLQLGVGEHVAMVSYLAGTAACGCALALGYGWRLTLAGGAVVPLALLVQALVAKHQTKCAEEETAAYGRAGRLAQEVLAAVRTVRAYAGEQLEVQLYGAALAQARNAARRRGAWAGAGLGLGWLLTYSINAVVFAYGARLVVQDRDLPPERQDYHPGVMVTVLFCTFMAAQNIAMCGPHLELFSSARGAARSLFRLVERAPAIDARGERGAKPASFRGDIVFDDVHFNYPSRPDVQVLRGLSLTVRAGETVALVGGSGSGKSTVLQLLLRLYEPRAGGVRVAGHRLQELHLRHYRTSIGVVGQEPVLFSGTVRDNITLGMADVSEERLVAAARLAGAHDFITKLAEGYDTEVGGSGGGAALSGGQKQRVAIARALLREPALLVLDEPTAALDAAAERQVQAALDAAARGRTTLVVSHRLSTIKNATRIVYLERGVVVEQGSHEELVARRGKYWSLLQEDLMHRTVVNNDTETPSADERPEPSERPLQRSSGRSSAAFRGSTRAAWRGSVRASLRLPAAALGGDAHRLEEDVAEEEGEGEKEGARVSWREAARLLQPEWVPLAGGGLASLAIGATMPVFAFLFSKLYGMFAWPDGEEVVRAAQTYALLFLGAAALSGLVSFLQAWLFSRAGAALADRLRQRTLHAFLAQEQAWFDEPANSTGALCARLAADCAAIKGATGTTLGAVLQGISTMVLGVGLAMLYSWKMTLVSLLSVPCVIGGIYLEGWMSRRSAARSRRALEHAARLATEAVLNVRTVQSLGVERALVARYAAALSAGEGAGAGAGGARLVRGLVYGVGQCAPTLGYAVSLAYGGYLIARDDLPYEYAILVSEALIYGAWMLAEALSFAPSLAGARRATARVLAALARRPALADAPDALDDPAWVCKGEVTLKDVEFAYPRRAGAPVLRGLSLRLEAGRTLALVGASGCGKSTVVQLLLRNYDAQRGRVELDGRDVRSLSARATRAALGLVAQEPALFERSLRDNIAYGDNSRQVPIEEVVHAAKQANIHNFIVGLPMGYETVVGAGGAALSGGQRQRVGIARALVRDPRVLVLDEATSALDAASEKAVQAALEAAARGRSALVIAHRLATVRRADTIAVIDRGVVAESGSHDELVERRGKYWRLLQQQQGHAAP